MSTVVCQGLESSSQLAETETLVRLKLAFPKKTSSSSSSPPPNKEINGGGGCWGFLHALSNTSSTNYSQSSTSYVHPKARSASVLSGKSLELCTESLGSETGSHDTLDDVFSTTPSSDDDDVSKVGETTSHERQGMGFSSSSFTRKIIVNENNSNACKNFPPPLTASSLQFRPHREGGRLIIAAVEGPPSPRSCLRAERSHGRLRLALWSDCPCGTEENIGDGEIYSEEEEEEEEEEDEEEEEEEELFGEDEGEERNVYGREDVDGNSLDVGVEMGMETLQRPSRCKEGGHGNKGLCNWEPFWVAT